MKLSSLLLSCFAAVVLLAGPCFGAEDDSRKYNFGIRVDYMPFKLFTTSTATGSTTKPLADYTYTGSTKSPKLAFGPVFEMRLTKRISIGAELSYHQAKYTQVTQIRSGKKDPNAGTDNRPVATNTENTRATYWDVPVIARYRNLVDWRVLRHMYPLAGLEYRRVSGVKTGNEIINADSTTDYNETPAGVAHSSSFGFVGGIGYRFVDELGIKVIPEIRFTRWMNRSFDGLSYRSNQNQASAGIGITF